MATIMTTTDSDASPTRIARLNAWFFDTFDGVIDVRLRKIKASLFADLPGLLIEIGAGTGANLRYYAPGTIVHAVEPSPAMTSRIARRGRARGIDLRITTTNAERLPFDDASVEAVVSTLVLCSVADPAAVIAEVRRVLRPGGRFIFLEHVIAPRTGVLRAAQRIARRPWSWAFDGCDTCRDTETTIRAHDWSRVTISRRRAFDPLVYPVTEQIFGSATR